MYKAYVFDFDYTLANSEKGIVMCFQLLFEAEGYDGIPEEAIRRTIGMTMYDAMANLTINAPIGEVFSQITVGL